MSQDDNRTDVPLAILLGVIASWDLDAYAIRLFWSWLTPHWKGVPTTVDALGLLATLLVLGTILGVTLVLCVFRYKRRELEGRAAERERQDRLYQTQREVDHQQARRAQRHLPFLR